VHAFDKMIDDTMEWILEKEPIWRISAFRPKKLFGANF
jgi:hypothetical protein